jgi:hypothetical protein
MEKLYGMSYRVFKKLTDSRKIELICDHFQLDITHDIARFDSTDCAVYAESTADGYEVFIVTNNANNPSICEDVYYYDHDISEAFREQIRYGDTSFYIDEYIWEDCYIEDMLLELFEEYVHDIDSTKLTPEERNYIKDNYAKEDEEYIKMD